ncbi:putative ribonuclease H-like domain-containing protein [Tanacetum coccineum]|uniref:Ribonuclease H-like domain-containing protein n=1 Tax=Tanacetum coccineum TaxID=301880 RepID=A0ABQ4ZXV6_9ASTR
MLLMALLNEHLLTFNQYKDAKTLFAAIQTRFGGNDATKKTHKSLLKQMYENFSASSTESLDSIFNRLQKIRNKPNLDTMSFDDLYKNFKIVEQEVKGTTSSSSSLSSQNLAFMSSTSSTNEVNTAYGVSTANTQASTASTQVSTNSKLKGSRNQDNRSRNQDNSRRTINVEEISSKAMLAIDGAGFDWSFMADEEVPSDMALMAFSDSETHNDKTCSKTCLKSFETLKTQLDDLRIEFNKSEFNLAIIKEEEVPTILILKAMDTKIVRVLGNISNDVMTSPDAPLFDDLKKVLVQGHFNKETRSSKTDIVMPLWERWIHYFDSSSKNAVTLNQQPSSDIEKKDDERLSFLLSPGRTQKDAKALSEFKLGRSIARRASTIIRYNSISHQEQGQDWLLRDILKKKHRLMMKFCPVARIESAFLYDKIEEEVYVCQPLGFEDPNNPDEVYKVVKALYGLHQAPRACQDKYVADISRKFGFTDVRTASTPIDTEKPLLKDSNGDDVDVHLYMSMIGSLISVILEIPPLDLVAYSNRDLLELVSERKSKQQKSEGSEGFHQIVDFLTASHISTLENGDMQITATIDGKVKVVSEASIRRHLKLEDSDGISDLPTTEIFEQLALMGNMKRVSKAYTRVDTPLFQTMLVQGQILQGEGSTIPVESHHTPTVAPSTSQLHHSPTLRDFIRQETAVPQPSSPTQTHVADEAASTGVDVRHGGAATIVSSLDAGQGSGNIDKTPAMPYDSPLPRVHTLGSDEGRMQHNELMDLVTKLLDGVVSLETGLQQTKKVYGDAYTKLIKKVKRLEDKLNKSRRKRRLVLSEEEDSDTEILAQEDPSKQGRKIAQIDDDEGITLVHIGARTQGRHDHEMEADFEFTTAEDVSTANVPVNTAGAEISTVSPKVKTAGVSVDDVAAEGLVYIRRSAAKRKDKGKAIMEESEPTQTKTKIQQEQERLGFEEAQRLHEQFDEEERQRITTGEELAHRLQAQERERYSEADKAKLLVELINERKRQFAQQRAQQRRNMPLTRAQQRSYMCNYIKHMGSHTLLQLRGYSFDEIKVLFEAIVKRVNTFTPMKSDDTVPKVVTGSSKRSTEEEFGKESSKRQKIGDGSELAEESKDKESDELSQ